MKTITITVIILLTYSGLCSAQTISGLVTDKESHEALAYVNIGLVGKTIGTISDIDGQYSLTVSDANYKDTIKFSSIGYESLALPVKTFIQQYQSKKYNVPLLKKNITLSEVEVKAKKIIHTATGNPPGKDRMCIVSFNPNNRELRGHEIGATMKIKKNWTYLENAYFHFGYITEDSILFRVNVYNLKNGVPDSNLLAQPIYFTTKLEQGTVSVDLKPYNIVVYDTFFISLEWIDSHAQGRLCVSVDSGSKPNSGSFQRTTSQDKWRDFGTNLKFFCSIGVEKK